MRTLGIDLSASPARTGVCSIDWDDGHGIARLHQPGLEDEQLVELIVAANKTGIDCPLGWPEPFVNALAAHTNGDAWPGRCLDPSKYRDSLRFRRTDSHVMGLDLTRKPTPLSVSTDRIGVTAMRCANLLDLLAVAGHPIDRSGSGLVAEVYPAAALQVWGLDHRGYKRAAGSVTRLDLVARLLATRPDIALSDADRACLEDSDDDLDALIAALVAREVALNKTPLPRTEEEQRLARIEGWIHLPPLS